MININRNKIQLLQNIQVESKVNAWCVYFMRENNGEEQLVRGALYVRIFD